MNDTRLNSQKPKKTSSSSSMSMIKARKSSLTDLRKIANQDEPEPDTLSCTKKDDSATLISQKFYSNDESNDLGSLLSTVTSSTTMRLTDKVTDKCFETLERISFPSAGRVKEYAHVEAIRMTPETKKDKSKSLAYCIPVWYPKN